MFIYTDTSSQTKSKAFDRVWHRGLLHKLENIGCTGQLLEWFRNYLSDRKQRVVIRGQSSNWADVEAGVPQGSVLGPLLFLIFINDIVHSINSFIRLFADDTSLYIIVDNPNEAAITLNTDLDKIYKWAEIWLVEFNPLKTFTMTISRRLLSPPHPPLIFNNVQVQVTQSHKHLGLTFSSNCTWSEHIKLITRTAWQRLNMLRGLKFKLKRKSLEKLYIGFVRPLLEYSDTVWDNCSVDEKNQLESIHVEAGRIITGSTKYCNKEKILQDLHWETLADRRTKHRLILFYKMVHHMTPTFLSDLVPPFIHETNRYNLRNANDIQSVNAQSNLFKNSFIPATVRDWNNLPLCVRQSESLPIFKSRLFANNTPWPSYYNAGSRVGQILHTRLRLDCSALNYDLNRRKLIDSKLCECGEVENAKHFIFQCPLFNEHRQLHLSDLVTNCSLRDLLFGSNNLTDQENADVFQKVQMYILETKRFLKR